MKGGPFVRTFVFWLLIMSITACFGGSIAYFARPWFDAAKVILNVTQHSAASTGALPTFTHTPTPLPAATAVAPRPTPTATYPPIHQPAGRTNLLLLASDNDKKNGPQAFYNTQVIMFISFDTVHNQVYWISIPRDLWLEIPGYTTDKIDTAPAYGGVSGLERTIETSFGVTIDHYAWVGLAGFVKIIDSLGGVDINVLHPIVENDFPDDLNPQGNPYAYRRFFIPPGPQHLDGVTALEYVRARHADLISDFGRSERQQQVLLQIRAKLHDADIVTLAPQIIQDLSDAQTDMTIGDLLGLARPVLALKSTSIHRYILTDCPSGCYTSDATENLNGAQLQVLLPNWDKIRALFGCVLSDQAYLGCSQ